MSDQDASQSISPAVPPLVPPASDPVIPYAHSITPRPGILSTIAILSICFGSLGILANLCGAMQSFSWALLRRMPSTASGPNPFSGMSLAPSIAAAIMAIVELGLACYLIFCGIILLRNRASARRHHMRYATWKIPVAVISAVLIGLTMYEFYHTIMTNSPAPQSSAIAGPVAALVAVVAASVSLVLSVAYPIFLLIVLTRASVRAYFDTLA